MTELFIVRHGDAVKLAKAMRDRFTQAVLTVGTDILEIREADLIEVLDNDSCMSVIKALGIGIDLTEQGAEEVSFETHRLRYGKIIFAMDDAPDGQYVRKQLLALFYRFFRPWLKAGLVYTIRVDGLALTSESEFEKRVMDPSTRSLNPVRLADDLESTLAANR